MKEKTADGFLTQNGIFTYADTIKLSRSELIKLLEEYRSSPPVQRIDEKEIEEMAEKEFPVKYGFGAPMTGYDENDLAYKLQEASSQVSPKQGT